MGPNCTGLEGNEGGGIVSASRRSCERFFLKLLGTSSEKAKAGADSEKAREAATRLVPTFAQMTFLRIGVIVNF